VKIDFTRTINDLDGRPFKIENDELLTLGRVVISALHQGEKLTGDEKYKRHDLMVRIHSQVEPVELKVDEVVLLKQVVGESNFTAWVSGEAWDMLEGKKES
jgi:hypothetical protein